MKDQRLASRETAHYLINYLIREEGLNKKEINSQAHYLTNNQDNEFNRVNKELSEIEIIINTMDERINEISKRPEIEKNTKK